MKKKVLKQLWLVLTLALSASAGVIYGSGGPQAEKIFFPVPQTGQTVWGFDQKGTPIEISSAFGPLKAEGSEVELLDIDLLDSLTISVPGHSFDYMLFDLACASGWGCVAQGHLEVFSTPPTRYPCFTFICEPYFVGLGPTSVTATDQTVLDELWIHGLHSGPMELDDLEIAGVSGERHEGDSPTPEPGTLLLLGPGMLGLNWWRRIAAMRRLN